MSDDGNANGEVIDSPTVNSLRRRRVDRRRRDGADAARRRRRRRSAHAGYDPAAYTVDEVQAYVAKHPDQRRRRAGRRAGRQEPGHARPESPGGTVDMSDIPDPLDPEPPPVPEPEPEPVEPEPA